MSGTDETMAMSGGGDQTMAAGGGPPTTPGGGGSEGDDNGSSRPWWVIPIAILLFGVLIGAAIAIAGGGGDDEEADDTTSTSTSTTTSTTSTTSPPATQGTTNGTQPSNDPKITSFSGNKSSPYTCTSPDPMVSTSIPGISYTVSWQTQNTSSVDLSVDGPGIYQSYNGQNGSQSFTYDCSDQTHTFLITAKGPNGPNAQQQISFTINDTAT